MYEYHCLYVARDDPVKTAALEELKKGDWLGVAGELKFYPMDENKPPRMTIMVESMARITDDAGAGHDEEEDEE
jgi:hypothetical protein